MIISINNTVIFTSSYLSSSKPTHVIIVCFLLLDIFESIKTRLEHNVGSELSPILSSLSHNYLLARFLPAQI